MSGQEPNWSLEIERDGVWVPTRIQSGDRIRVRPGQKQFIVRRPEETYTVILGHRIPMRTGSSVNLRLVDGLGGAFTWAAIPSGSDDEIMRIARYYGPSLFLPVGNIWQVEYPPRRLDGRFDYVAFFSRAKS